MKFINKKIGFAMTGSFCTFTDAFNQLVVLLSEGAELTPIISYAVRDFDTRFGKAAEHRRYLETMCHRPIIDSIPAAEPIGPKALLDMVIVCPCTGNTLAKIVNGITDTPVTMAVKAHLRNKGPVLLAVASNDALSGNAKNLGLAMNERNIYFVPMRQDSPEGKPSSLVAVNELLAEAAEAAFAGRQLQPMLLG